VANSVERLSAVMLDGLGPGLKKPASLEELGNVLVQMVPEAGKVVHDGAKAVDGTGKKLEKELGRGLGKDMEGLLDKTKSKEEKDDP